MIILFSCSDIRETSVTSRAPPPWHWPLQVMLALMLLTSRQAAVQIDESQHPQPMWGCDRGNNLITAAGRRGGQLIINHLAKSSQTIDLSFLIFSWKTHLFGWCLSRKVSSLLWLTWISFILIYYSWYISSKVTPVIQSSLQTLLNTLLWREHQAGPASPQSCYEGGLPSPHWGHWPTSWTPGLSQHLTSHSVFRDNRETA